MTISDANGKTNRNGLSPEEYLDPPPEGWAPPSTEDRQVGPTPAPAPPADQLDGLAIILQEFKRRYEPTFKRKTTIYSAKEQREVTAAEATYAADRQLLGKLAAASNAPRHKKDIDRDRLPAFFWAWAKSAWAELLRELPVEEACGEIAASREEEFHRQVATALFAQATFTSREKEPERRTLLQWCQVWAKPGAWQPIRAALLWCRKDEHGLLCVALRVELFGQYGPQALVGMPQREFARLAAMYGVGTSNYDDRPGGRRVVVLCREFLEELCEGPEKDALPQAMP